MFEQHDRTVEEPLDLLIRVILGIVVEFGPRLIDRLFDDDVAVQVGEHLPAPCLQDQPDTQQIPALLGRGFVVHVDQVLAERPVDVPPLLRAVITAGVVAHFSPALPGAEGRRRRVPLLRVMAHEATIELRRRHQPVQHRRQVEVRRDRLRAIRIRVDVEEVVAAGRAGQGADQERSVYVFHGQNPTLRPKLTPRGIGKFPKSIPTAPEPPTAGVFPLMIGSRPV